MWTSRRREIVCYPNVPTRLFVSYPPRTTGTTVNGITLIGLAAAACTTLAFLPQAVKNWRTKSAGDLSFTTFGLFTVGVLLWLAYGLLIRDLPIILANLVTAVLTSINLVQMVVYRNRAPQDGASGQTSA